MEPEWKGPIWRHPYFLYVLLTVGLFGFLVLVGWVAYQADLIPKRSPSSRAQAAEADPLEKLSLQLKWGSETRRYSVSELTEKLGGLKSLTTEDPVSRQAQIFEGFYWRDIKALAGVGADVRADEVALECDDGYTPTARLPIMDAQNPLLAIRARPAQGSKPYTVRPFYLVWKDGRRFWKPESGASWPYALVSIELIEFAQKYPGLYPTGRPSESAEMRGFRVFKNQCFKCHALNQQGGKMGPEFNQPRNILSYWNEKDFLAFARNPQSYRVSSAMPPQKDLTPERGRDLISYLRYLSK